jgi:hypothetical protein
MHRLNKKHPQMVENCDHLFDQIELSAVPQDDTFNSNIFVFQPKVKTFEEMLDLSEKLQTGRKYQNINK